MCVGFLAFWIYYNYFPNAGKRELNYIAKNLGKIYDKSVEMLLNSISKILYAKERLWEKIDNSYVETIVSGATGMFNEFLRYLELLNSKKSSKSYSECSCIRGIES